MELASASADRESAAGVDQVATVHQADLVLSGFRDIDLPSNRFSGFVPALDRVPVVGAKRVDRGFLHRAVTDWRRRHRTPVTRHHDARMLPLVARPARPQVDRILEAVAHRDWNRLERLPGGDIGQPLCEFAP